MFDWLDKILTGEDVAKGGGITPYTDWDAIADEDERDITMPESRVTGGDVSGGYTADYVEGYEPDWEAIADEDSNEIVVPNPDSNMYKEVLQKRVKEGK